MFAVLFINHIICHLLFIGQRILSRVFLENKHTHSMPLEIRFYCFEVYRKHHSCSNLDFVYMNVSNTHVIYYITINIENLLVLVPQIHQFLLSTVL